MSTTGLIQTDANWNLSAPSGNLNLNYNTITRQSPTINRVISNGVVNQVDLILTDSITTEGIYFVTVVGDFSSTPWNFRWAFFIPLGTTALVGGSLGQFDAVAVPAFHAQNGVTYNVTLTHLTVGTNYQRPGLRMYFNNNISSGSITVKAYRFV